jgi:hypothetical protein
VKRINDAIKARGVIPWFDEERMSGETRQKMVDGIENSDVIVVFVTEAYRDKTNSSNGRDNCRFEFTHASNTKAPSRFIAVVMEPRCYDTSKWFGKVGSVLASLLHVPFVDDNLLAVAAADIAGKIHKIITMSVADRLAAKEIEAKDFTTLNGIQKLNDNTSKNKVII